MSRDVGLDPHDLSELLGLPLSAEQLAAATAPLAPGLIVAGAGSGKTTVMAARVVWLVGTGAVPVAGILGLTFTNKAAAELLHRIKTALRRLSPQAAAACDDAVVSTYHSFAGALLREFGLLIGVEPAAELMSAVRQRQLAYGVAARSSIDHRAASGSPGDVAAAILSLDSLLADSDVSTEALMDFDSDILRALADRADQQRVGERMLGAAQARRQLAGLVEEYRTAKRERELIDFADYVRLGVQLARSHPELSAMMRDRHPAVLLDEYQDTSVAQRGMLQALFSGGHAVTAVGDPCQAIYGWRGASPFNMDAFPEHFAAASGDPAAVFTLATNRRSGARVLTLANEIAADLRAVHRDVVQLRPDSRNGAGAVVCGLLPTVAQELTWLADRVAAQNRPWRDIAVLVRTNDSAADVVAALRAQGIPVQVHGRQALLALPEVRWITWGLRLSADPSANDAAVGLLTGPPWRIGARDMAVLARRAADLSAAAPPADAGPRCGAASDVGADLMTALESDPLDAPCLVDAVHDPGTGERYPYSAAARQRLSTVSALLRSWQRRAGSSVADLVRAIAGESGLLAELELGAIGGAPGRPADDSGFVALIDLARRFDDVDRGRTLSDFLAWIAVAEALPDGPEAPAPPTHDAVTVMTVHASKGLEFPVVAVPGLVKGSFPSDRGRARWPTNPNALPAALSQEPLPEQILGFPSDPSFPRAGEFTDFSAACRAADRLEEVRLAYVAVTRAKEALILSGHRWGRTQVKPRQPSEFLAAAVRLAEDGHSELAVWSLPPDPESTNPLLGTVVDADPPADDHRVDWAMVAAEIAAAPDGGTLAAGHAPPSARDAARIEAWDRDLETLRSELALRRAPARAVLPADLSVSHWMAASRDPEAFALQLLRPVPLPASRSAAEGEQFHDWLADAHGQLALWDTDDLIDAADALSAQQQALRAAFASSPFGSLPPVAVEHPIAVRVGDRVVRGRIDAVIKTGSEPDTEYWVVDWKTGASGRADPLQLALYRAAWAAQEGVPVERVVGCFVYLADRRYDVYRELPDVAGLQRMFDGATVGRAAARLAPTQTFRWGQR